VRTRFAPSPTGYLHLGHVVNAIYVWGIARAGGAEVLLRVEDHDRIRSRPEFEQALLEDLDWLEFAADAGRSPLLRQSDEPGAYASALDSLRQRHHVYACSCSRKEIGAAPYDGRCRERGLPWEPGLGLRVVVAGGPPEGGPYAGGGEDLLIRDRDGHWTYQFSVVVDDLRQGITLVIRGEDLRDSTDRQIALGRMLGRAVPPEFIHHPLILKPDGEKLSKAAADTGIRELRAAGLSPADVIGRAAGAVQLIPGGQPVAASEVNRLFG
jgi:glutamyl-tRNA synthetase/glutamyl-Q tRNA(Asp) synthetase